MDFGQYGNYLRPGHLLNNLRSPMWNVTYWRDGNDEVDFVVSHGSRNCAVEVKSGQSNKLSGLAAFRKRHPQSDVLIIGSGGVTLEKFFSSPADGWWK